MGNLSLLEAFATFGGKPANRLSSVSAMASDGGAMILGCSSGQFGHPARGVLRYEDRLSREAERPIEVTSLGQHLTLARDGNLPIRMVVITDKAAAATGKVTRDIHVRHDLVGKLVKFDGDHYIVDFVRVEEPAQPATAVTRR